MVVWFANSASHHWCCEFESRSGRGVQHYVIKFVSDLSVAFSGSFGFLHHWNWPPRCNWDIVESGVKHYQANKQIYFLSCFWRLISFLLWYVSISYNKQHLYKYHTIYLNRHKREQSNNIHCTWQWEDINQHRRCYWMVSNYSVI